MSIYLSPDKNVQWVLIPKNASTFVRSHLSDLDWKQHDISNNNISTFAILRNPLQRWISGFVQDLQNYSLTPTTDGNQIVNSMLYEGSWFLDFIFKASNFEIGHHTELQTSFLDPNNSNITFFNLDDNLNLKLHKWLKGKGIQNNFIDLPPMNEKKQLEVYQKIYDYIHDSKNIGLKNRLLDHLDSDFKLYYSVKFF